MEPTEKAFDQFMGQLQLTNIPLSAYTDFHKAKENTDTIAIRLNQLNYLLGCDDIASSVHHLWAENPKVFSVLGILIAVRDTKVHHAINGAKQTQALSDYLDSPTGVIVFLEDSGLADLFRSKRITNLVDYVFGIEVGLDSNARKNRFGRIMERQVAQLFDTHDINYREQVPSGELAGLENLGTDIKRFDFVITTSRKTYLVEVNFYNSSGSKLNEVARAYTDLSQKVNACAGYEFVWITDGQNWQAARNKIEAAYHSIPAVYNLTTIADFIAQIKDEVCR